ncbi:MAG TPA: YetF domain-containing protein [Polyangiaceae bacterium]|nr:YetF domain-containing protein [Polyangiaceae bacterium]
MSLETWRRILLGSAPFGFAIEVFLRTVVVYLLLIAAVRLLGKRMSGQLTNLELGVMLALGAIVSVPMQAAERGVVPGLVLLVCIVLLQRAFGQLEACSLSAARLLIGKTSILVRDGVILPRELEQARVSQQQLFSVLRAQHVRHLGEVERVYLEAFGAFSVLRRAQPTPGLSVFPSTHLPLPHPESGASVCSYCGQRAPDTEDASSRCENCQEAQWTEPVQVETSAAA